MYHRKGGELKGEKWRLIMNLKTGVKYKSFNAAATAGFPLNETPDPQKRTPPQDVN